MNVVWHYDHHCNTHPQTKYRIPAWSRYFQSASEYTYFSWFRQSRGWVMAIRCPPLIGLHTQEGQGITKSYAPCIRDRVTSLLSPSQLKIALHIALINSGSEAENIWVSSCGTFPAERRRNAIGVRSLYGFCQIETGRGIWIRRDLVGFGVCFAKRRIPNEKS